MPERVSYSSITDHRLCPQKYNYSTLQHLESVAADSIDRHFGSWWHALRAADSIRRTTALGLVLAVVPRYLKTPGGRVATTAKDGSVKEDVLSLAGEWWDKQDPELRGLWSASVGDLSDRLRQLDRQWLERWGEQLQHERPLAVELWWERELTPRDSLGGFVDEVFLDTRREIVVVRDHKTSRALGKQSAAEDMMDSQLQLYAWGTEPLVHEWGYQRVSALSYDRVRATAPKTPVLTKSGALSKSVTDFDLDTYRAWAGVGIPFEGLKKDGSGAGVYTVDLAVVERLSSPEQQALWLDRTLTPLNRRIVGAHLQAAVDSAEDMRRTRARVGDSGEAARNLTRSCSWCDYVNLCRAQLVGGPGGEYDLELYGLKDKSKD